MIVRLTSAQIAALDKALDGSPLGPWFGHEVEFLHAGHTQFDCRSIPDFWLAVADHVIHHHLSPGSARPRTATLAAAVKRIVTEVNRYRTHPAFRGECLLGDVPIWFPVWVDTRAGEIPNPLEPFRPAEDFWDLRRLRPGLIHQAPHWFTCWNIDYALQLPDDPVLQFSTHERFRRALAGPEVVPTRRSSGPAD